MSIRICGAFSGRSESETFHMLLPQGERCWLLVHFRNPVRIKLGGEEIVTEPDACVIYPPHAPQDYSSLPGGFTNDYVKFIADEEDPVRENGLPVNEVFYVSPGYQTIERFDRITWALTDVLNDHSLYMAENFYAILKELISSRINRDPKARRDSLTLSRLGMIREQIKAEPYSWNVEKMAAAFYMTRSHFSVLYKRHFGITPGADLHNFTMSYAKKLLKETKLSVEDISQKCGYSSCENFIRSFKKYFGSTPLKYRKNIPDNDERIFP